MLTLALKKKTQQTTEVAIYLSYILLLRDESRGQIKDVWYC